MNKDRPIHQTHHMMLYNKIETKLFYNQLLIKRIRNIVNISRSHKIPRI